MKDKAIDVGNDATVCFDHMIKNCQNLSCPQQGANIQIPPFTHTNPSATIKDSRGVSLNYYNKFTPDHPWYGAGQGAGNATIWWVVLSHSLLTA